MKKILLTTIIISIVFAACNNSEAPDKGLEQVNSSAAPINELHKEIYGNYVGMFEDADADTRNEIIEPAKVNITISQITESGVSGRSIVKGNDRPMAGQMSVSGDLFKFVMDEPGSDPHDGRFTFSIQGDSLFGTWECYDGLVKSPKKKFVLKKMPFAYNANLMLPGEWDYVDWTSVKNVPEIYKNEDGSVDTVVYDFYRAASDNVYKMNASKNKLKEADLKNLKKLDLEIIRNTIYARHGYSFKKKSVRQFFDQVEWYMPMSNNVDSSLTVIEKDNIALLKRFEKYAEDNYDTFGR